MMHRILGTFILFLVAWGLPVLASVQENCQLTIPPRQAGQHCKPWIVLLRLPEGGKCILQRLSDHVGRKRD